MTAHPGARGVPLTVHLAGLRVVVVGAGPVAARKIRRLIEAGANVTVVAPEAVEPVRDAAAAGRLRMAARPFRPDDLHGAVLVVAATDQDAVNAAIAARAAERGVLCVRADGGGTADFAAAVRRGPLTITVATGGAAPSLARRVKDEIADRYDEAYGVLATILGELRRDPGVEAVLRVLPGSERAARWRSASSPDILTLIRAGRRQRAKEVARSCLLSSSD